MNDKNIYVSLHDGYTKPIVKESQKEEWVEYGEDNNYYQWLINRYISSPTNNAVINNIIKLIYGKGLTALNASSKPNDYASMIGLLHKDCIKQLITDLKMLGQCAIQVVYSKGNKSIAELHHMPIQLLRTEKCNEDGNIEGYWYSDDWTDIKKNAPQRIPKFGTSKESIEIFCIQNYSVGMKYYSYVDYQGSLPYTVLEEEIGEYLINEVQNGFSGTKIINFNNGIPSTEEREIIKNDTIAKVTGSRGNRTIVAFNHSETNKTTIDDVPLNDAPNHYEYLSDECMRKIMLGHNVTSPLLFGVASTNGFSSNADELKNSFTLYYNMVIKPYQETLIDAFATLLAYNNINLKLHFTTLQPLVFEGEQMPEEKHQEKMAKTKKPSISELLVSKFNGHKKDRSWILIDEFDADKENGNEIDLELSQATENFKKDKLTKPNILSRLKRAFLVSTGNAYPDEISIDDWIINDMYFITRYKYEGNINSNSREFCKAMINADLLYRKEDIEEMSDSGVNAGFGPNGADNYDILRFKGGANCYHLWRRQTYVGLDTGIPLDPNSSLAKSISTNKAEKYGYRIRNPFETAVAPINLPNQGYKD